MNMKLEKHARPKKWFQSLVKILIVSTTSLVGFVTWIQVNKTVMAHEVPHLPETSGTRSWSSQYHPAASSFVLQHYNDDFAPMDAQTEQRMYQMTQSHRRFAIAANDPTQRYLVGQWSDLYDWPVVAIHTSLLANGKVLAWDSLGDLPSGSYPAQNYTRATLWDPITNQHTSVDNSTTGYNLFCSGHAHLPDGKIYIAGGNVNADLQQGTNTTHFFDPADNSWSLGPFMQQGGRWYPSVTPQANGEMLITSGGPPIPEVRQVDGMLRSLTKASLTLPLYPWLQVAPDGRSFSAGPDNALRYLSTGGTGSWQTRSGGRDGLNRDYGSYAMYDIGKILVAGGGSTQRNSAVVIDLNNGGQPAWTNPMSYARRQHNLTILADGTVLATGGLSSTAKEVDLSAGVYAAELWNPTTGQWQTLSSMQETRQYHSSALLLPDGRVLSAGGGVCGYCQQVGYLAKSAEIFSPPYLFKKDGSGDLAARPTIDAAPDTVGYGQGFTINTPQADGIQKVAMIRLGSVTHSVNMEQRYVPLSFTGSSGTLSVISPTNANIAPPGYYMLFVIDSNGVPSVAKMVNVNGPAPTPAKLWPEAESGSISLPMQSLADANASGGRYITVAPGNNSGGTPPTSGIATYTLNITSAGTYKIWGRTITPTAGDDSFWVQVDNGTWYNWNGIALSTAWAWRDVRNYDAGNAKLTWNLSTGSHTLKVAYREDGAKLDRLLVTNDLNFVPSGLGGN
jgi:hypothetical protein